jgi:hypothetical protein
LIVSDQSVILKQGLPRLSHARREIIDFFDAESDFLENREEELV